MKNFLRSVTYCSILSVSLLLSCQNEDISGDKQTSSKNLAKEGYLQSEKVRVPEGVDLNAIQITTRTEAGNYVATVFSDKPGRVAAISELDPYALSDLLLEKIKSYPVFDFSLEQLPADQLERIQQDFPDIKTQEEAYNKRETVTLYYENLLRYDFIEAVKGSDIPTTSGGRAKAPSETSNSLPGGWGWLAATYPMACAKALQSRDQINAETNNRFPGGNQDGFRSNAFRHSGWCGLVARKLIAEGSSKENGVGDAGLVCSSFECESVNFDPSQPNSIFMVQKRTKEAAMDLYNNSIGRSYIYNNTTFGLFGVRKDFPSEGYFLNVMRDRNCIENAFLPTATSAEQIIGYNNPDETWANMYRHNVSNWYSFARLYDGQNCN